MVELGLTSGGPPLVQGSLAAREVSKDAVRTPDRVTERGKGSKGRVVGNSLLQEAVGAADKVPAVKGDSAFFKAGTFTTFIVTCSTSGV